MKYIYLALATCFLTISSFAQNEQCGTMEVLKMNLEKDPSLKNKMLLLEKETALLTKARGMSQINYSVAENNQNQNSQKSQGVASLCGYNNTYFTTIAAPTTLNQKVSPNPNCTYGGEYVTITGLTQGRTYRVSLCGANNFDTQLTIYPQGGGNAVAHNDDWCGSQSEIYFTPMTSGNYDILVDAYNCTSNTLCATMEVELWNIPRPKITIPVVVHVIHFGEAYGTGRNITDAQINSQISVLNADFRRLNGDIFQIPAAFRGTSADPLIEFCLAQQDEFGNPTTGIKRYISTNPQITVNDMETSIKQATIWDRNKYLNIWTVDFGAPNATLLGYAQFPGGAANTDGVVIRFTAFGNTGNITAPFNLGRTTTHEVGHWLNLRHIWGDEPACAQDDFVSDTPLQADKSSGAPSFPFLDACAVNYPGINFYNYMDYSDDAITSMFSYGQWVRMDAALFGPRLSLQNSVGCISTIGINENALANQFTIFPNPSNGTLNIKYSLIDKPIKYQITNLIGQIIEDNSISSDYGNEFVLNLSNEKNGIYFLKITVEGQSFIKKIILTK